eukprot:1961416-Rhodomonas_salina.1
MSGAPRIISYGMPSRPPVLPRGSDRNRYFESASVIGKHRKRRPEKHRIPKDNVNLSSIVGASNRSVVSSRHVKHHHRLRRDQRSA